MRIDIQAKCTPVQRFQLSMIEMMIGKVPAPITVMTYRRDFWGKPMTDCFEQAMRQGSAWTKPEVELFAAMVSRSNTCQFCYESHKAVTILGFEDVTVEAALKDWRTAPISEKLRAALGFIEKLVKTPESLTQQDAKLLAQFGITEAATEELVYIAFCFSVINRMANALDFDLGTDTNVSRTARFLYHMGYGTGSIAG